MNLTEKEISPYELFFNKKIVEHFRKLSNSVITEQNIPEIIELLDKVFIYIVYSKHEYSFPEIYRLTINKNILRTNKRIKDIRHLKYPTDKKLITKYGRCNLQGQSVLYASLQQMTSLDELKPKVGDLITESTWRAKSETPLVYVPIVSNQPTNEPFINSQTGEIIERLTNIRTYEMNELSKQQLKHYPKNLKELCEIIDQFIADSFSKRVNSNNHFDYIFSAYFSNKLLYEIENGNINAIYYPSVPDKLNSENLSIKPEVFDELYQLVEVNESFIIRNPSDGRRCYEMLSIAMCRNFNYETNEIVWESNKYFQDDERIEFLKNKYGLDLV